VRRIDTSGTRRIHVGDYGCDPHGGIEQGKQRETRQVDFSGANPVTIAYLLDLPQEISVSVQDTLGRTRTSRRKDNRSWRIRVRYHGKYPLVRFPPKLLQCPASPEPPPTHGDVIPGLRETGALKDANGMHQRQRHESVRPDLLQATHQFSPSHPRVNQHHDHPGLEQRKSQQDELDAGAHHQYQTRTRRHAPGQQRAGDMVAVGVELCKGRQKIVAPPGGAATARHHDRHLVRHLRGGSGQKQTDVDAGDHPIRGGKCR
jgi:hypothetical protein